MIYKIIWSKRSLRQFKKLYEYIKKETPKGADKVREAIISTSEKLKSYLVAKNIDGVEELKSDFQNKTCSTRSF